MKTIKNYLLRTCITTFNYEDKTFRNKFVVIPLALQTGNAMLSQFHDDNHPETAQGSIYSKYLSSNDTASALLIAIHEDGTEDVVGGFEYCTSKEVKDGERTIMKNNK